MNFRLVSIFSIFMLGIVASAKTDGRSDADDNSVQDGMSTVYTRLDALERRLSEMESRERIYEQTIRNILIDNRRTTTELVRLHGFLGNVTSTLSHLNSFVPRAAVRGDRKRQAAGGGIAFTSYLDHDVLSININDPIVFNKMILNDGNAYDPATGIFTCPESGVYQFTFFLAVEGAMQNGGQLMLNGVNQVDAIAEGIQFQHSLQGGNSANLRLQTGDRVWVASQYGTHQEGDVGYIRFTTFSGNMLYG